jgi:hypothetical protein
MSIKIIFTTLSFIAIIIVIVVINIHLSLWFLWYLLPEGNVKVAVNSSQSGSQVLSDLLNASLVEDTTRLFDGAKRYSYIQTDTYSSVILVPKNPFLFRDRDLLIEQLNANDWQTTSFGLLIVGTTQKTEPTLNTLKGTVGSSLGKYFSRRHPYRPIVVAQGNDGSISLLSGDTALVGVATNFGRELKIIIASDLESLPNFSISRPVLSDEANYLAINILGSTIQSVSAQFSDEWNKIIYSKLGFSVTKPPIISYMTVQQTSSMIITNEKAALAIIGDSNALKDVFHQWMKDEEAYLRPQKRAFKLPDGTLGYELVKGDSQVVLAEPDSSGCLESLSEAIKLWLCVSDKGVAVATNKAAAVQELSSISASIQRVALGSDYLQHIDFLPIKHLKSLAVYSSGQYTILTAKLNK